MCKFKKRTFLLDDDRIEVLYKYDEDSDMYFGDYPDFAEHPRFTPNGKPWVNSMYTDCPFSPEDYGDCGTCKYFLREKPRDLIGVCTNQTLRKEQKL